MLWPSPMLAQARPPVLRDRVDPTVDDSNVFVTDVHAGPGLAGIPRGTVKGLRVIEYYFAKRGMGGLYGTLGSDGPWDIKRILGTVPVEDDGSAYFRMPANSPICVQPIDAQGRAIQLERSWFVGMPGERVSCIGCHEGADAAVPSRVTRAMQRPASEIEPWHWPARGFGFVREVQPVLDRHCVSCHDGGANQLKPRKGRELPQLKGGQALVDWKTQMPGNWTGGGRFTRSYWELQRFVRRPGIEGDRRMFTPMDYHFGTTELGQLLRKGHYGVKLDAESHGRLGAWVDLNAPFFGTWGEIPEFTSGYGPHECKQVSGQFVMGSTEGDPDERPLSKAEVKSFWMSRYETSNRQYRAYDGVHESRTEDRHGYQFGITGHNQDKPDQPAVRISWEEAMGFCAWLSHETGLQVSLPTEAQWEWACRSGTSSPFWYGDFDTDFSRHANLGDATLALFGGDPYVQDYAKGAFKNPKGYDNSIPQEARFHDGGFVTEPVPRYQPYPWGLHDLHGNAREWTRSAFRPYPYRSDAGRDDVAGLPRTTERVARGGSWRDRPFRGTSSYRLAYFQYQRVFDVGFRVICEDPITTVEASNRGQTP